MIHAYRGVVPKAHPSAWIAGSADVIGDVELAARVKRSVTDKALDLICGSAKRYISLAAEYRAAQGA